MKNFIDTADSRNTSDEIMSAISYIAKNNIDAERIWADPTDAEILSIWERVTNNGLIDAREFCWGASGSKWALTSELETK